MGLTNKTRKKEKKYKERNIPKNESPRSKKGVAGRQQVGNGGGDDQLTAQ